MKNGFEVEWTNHALFELNQTIEYLETFWTEKELVNFSRDLEHIIDIISRNPNILQNRNEGHRAEIDKLSTLYYRINRDIVEILSVFSNRQHPDKRKI